MDMLFSTHPAWQGSRGRLCLPEFIDGVETATRDVLGRIQLASMGIILIFIDEDSLEENPIYYVQEALRYRDHSRLGSRGL